MAALAPSAPIGTPAAQSPAPGPVRLRAAFLESYLARSERLAALKAEVKSLQEALDGEETSIIAALSRGAAQPEGFVVRVESSSSVRPAWKAIATDLAVAKGETKEAFEARIRASTAPTVTSSLVVTRL